MISPPKSWHKIQNDDERLAICKKYKLIAPTKKELKEFLYKGLYVKDEVSCTVVGYTDSLLIIDISGKLHSIHPDYLLQMQRKEFKLGENVK